MKVGSEQLLLPPLRRAAATNYGAAATNYGAAATNYGAAAGKRAVFFVRNAETAIMYFHEIRCLSLGIIKAPAEALTPSTALLGLFVP